MLTEGVLLLTVGLLVTLGGLSYLAYQINLTQRAVNRITGLLIANGWDLETGRQVKGNEPVRDPQTSERISIREDIAPRSATYRSPTHSPMAGGSVVDQSGDPRKGDSD